MHKQKKDSSITQRPQTEFQPSDEMTEIALVWLTGLWMATFQIYAITV